MPPLPPRRHIPVPEGSGKSQSRGRGAGVGGPPSKCGCDPERRLGGTPTEPWL